MVRDNGPVTLSVASYKRLMLLAYTIYNIGDMVAQGADVKSDLVIVMLKRLITEAENAIKQMEQENGNTSEN